jgi:hypothetical protein
VPESILVREIRTPAALFVAGEGDDYPRSAC